MGKSNKQVVLAFFDNEEAADKAVESLRAWDKLTDDIKLGAIGVLVKDEDGKIKQHKLGRRAGKKGAGIGVILGIVAAVLSGGVTLLGGLVGGAALGGVMGSLFHRGLGMSKEDLARFSAELDAGRAAVGVLVEDYEAASVSEHLELLGGKTESHEVSEETLAHADTAAAEPEATVTPAA